MPDLRHTHTAFVAHRRIATGPLHEVALAVQRALVAAPDARVLVFNDETGRQVDLDVRGTPSELAARYPPPPEQAPADAPAAPAPRGRGRPRLGVVAREVTLLPEHWEWLAAQPGGISVALRKLVHQARRSSAERDGRVAVRDRAYAFMSAMAGDLPGFEEAARALFAGDASKLAGVVAHWPRDVRDHLARLGGPGQAAAPPSG